MNCETCGVDKLEIAAKTTDRNAVGITKCYRLVCGHAWHVAKSTTDARSPVEAAKPARCTCREIAEVNTLLVEGRHHQTLEDSVPEDAFARWLEHVLQALDGIPAENGSPSLIRSATTAARSQTSRGKKMNDLNKLLERAIKTLS